jgi:hypothetical protein
MENFISTTIIINKIASQALEGRKIPHRISEPVIRKHEGIYVLAFFISFYTKENVQNKTSKRPAIWLTADIKCGEIINRYNCSLFDFCKESFDTVYSVKVDTSIVINKEYYEKQYLLLDKIREKIVLDNVVDTKLNTEYMERILNIVPDEYRIFYTELNVL